MGIMGHTIKQRIEKLRTELDHHNYLYYVDAKPTLSDQQYDRLMRELSNLESAHPEFASVDSPTQRVGGQPIDAFHSVTHAVPMMSIDNTYDEAEVRAFYANNSEALQRNRRLVDELKKLYGESQVDGDSLPEGLPLERILDALEVHHIKSLGQGGPDEKKNMIVLSATLHALIHADPECRIDLAKGTMTLFGVQLNVRIKPLHF